MEYIKPPKLNKDDTVGIISPSNTIADRKELINRAAKNFESELELKTVFSTNAFKQHYYSAGSPTDRLEDFHSMLNDDNIKAIIFSIGGDTAIDLLEGLDYEQIKKNPKIIAGISDGTTLLHAISAKTGLITFNGLELHLFVDNKLAYHVASLKQAWFEGKPYKIKQNQHWKELRSTFTRYSGWETIQGGKAKGRLVGGNFGSFSNLLNTEYALPFTNNILFFETYKFSKKRIHEALMQMKLHGALENLSGMIVGYCLQSDDEELVGNDQPIRETVLEVVEEYSFPVMHVGEIGHNVENTIQPLGAMVEMDATALKLEVLENVTN